MAWSKADMLPALIAMDQSPAGFITSNPKKSEKAMLKNRKPRELSNYRCFRAKKQLWCAHAESPSSAWRHFLPGGTNMVCSSMKYGDIFQKCSVKCSGLFSLGPSQRFQLLSVWERFHHIPFWKNYGNSQGFFRISQWFGIPAKGASRSQWSPRKLWIPLGQYGGGFINLHRPQVSGVVTMSGWLKVQPIQQS